MTSKHTPGPWLVEDRRNAGEGFSITTGAACRPSYGGIACLVDVEADARLIVEAPDLLKACQSAEWDGLLPEFTRDKLRAAVAKATGAPTDPH